MSLAVVLLLATASFVTNLASNFHPMDEKRRSASMVFFLFFFGYRYWELTAKGKRLRLWSWALMLAAVGFAIASALHREAG